MASHKIVFCFIVASVLAISMVQQAEASPQLDILGGYDFLGVCINNCGQCKKMYGAYFEGQKCAEACIKFKGKIIPDCEDIDSIAPFLGKIE